VTAGLCSVFELLRETQSTHPALCHRALLALLAILEGQPPEALNTEPADIVGMYIDWFIVFAVVNIFNIECVIT